MKNYTTYTFISKYLNREVEVFIYLPLSYNEGKRSYPVLYMFDGHNLFDDNTSTFGKSWGVPEMYRDLEDLPELIIVGTNAPKDGYDRVKEYSPYSVTNYNLPCHPDMTFIGRGHTVIDMMYKEVKPKIDSEYRTNPLPEATALGGSSMGGLLTTYGALHHTDKFSRFLCFSNAYHYNDREALKDASSVESVDGIKRLYMDIGEVEHSSGFDNDPEIYLGHNNEMYGILKERLEDRLMYVIDPTGEHNEASWEKRLPEALRFIFQDIK